MMPLSIEIGRSITGTPVYLTDRELGSHVEVEGLSGSGKSFFLEWLSRCFVKQQKGFFTITPHREYYDNMLNWLVVKGYEREVNLFDPTYEKKVVGLDFFWSQYAKLIKDEEPLNRTIEAQLNSQAEDLIRETMRVFGFSNSNDFGNIERRLRNLFYTLLERRLSITALRYFTHASKHVEERNQIIKKIKSEIVREAMEDYFHTSKAQFDRTVSSTLNKLQRFEHVQFQRVMGLPDNALPLKRILDRQEIAFAQLQASSSNVAGREINQVFGTMLIGRILDHVLKRGRKIRYFLLIDECDQYVSPGGHIEEALNQARKFGLRLFLIHQNKDQVSGIRGAMESAQTKIYFSTKDRPLPERHFLLKRPHTNELIEVIAPEVRQFHPSRKDVERYIAKILKNFLTVEQVDERLKTSQNEDAPAEDNQVKELTYRDFLK
jgi:DNA helicase HerA-like ATPase